MLLSEGLSVNMTDANGATVQEIMTASKLVERSERCKMKTAVIYDDDSLCVYRLTGLTAVDSDLLPCDARRLVRPRWAWLDDAMSPAVVALRSRYIPV